MIALDRKPYFSIWIQGWFCRYMEGFMPGGGSTKGMFLSRFGLKTGIDFEQFGLKLDMVIGGTFTSGTLRTGSL